MQNLTGTIFILIKYLDYVFLLAMNFSTSLCQFLSMLYINVQAHERRALCFEKVCVCVCDISKNVILWQRCLQSEKCLFLRSVCDL